MDMPVCRSLRQGLNLAEIRGDLNMGVTSPRGVAADQRGTLSARGRYCRA